MSRQIHYKLPFRSLDNTKYTVYISEEGYTGDVVTLTGASTPFETEEEGTDDVTTAVHYSTGYIRVIDEDGTLLRSFSKESPSAYLVYLRNESIGRKVWTGFLQQQAFSQPFVGGLSEVELPVISLIGFWYNRSLSTYSEDFLTIGAFLSKICLDVDGTQLLDSVVMPMDEFRTRTATSYYDMYSETDVETESPIDLEILFNIDIFKNEVAPKDYFVNSSYYGGPYTGGTYGDIMKELCTLFGWSFYEKGTELYVKSLLSPELANYARYNTDDLLAMTRTASPTYEDIVVETKTDLDWNSTDHTEEKIAPKQSLSLSFNEEEIDTTLFSASNSGQIVGGFSPRWDTYKALFWIAQAKTPARSLPTEFTKYVRLTDTDGNIVSNNIPGSITLANLAVYNKVLYSGGEFFGGQICGDLLDSVNLMLWREESTKSPFSAIKFEQLHNIHIGTPRYHNRYFPETLITENDYIAECLTISGNVYYGEYTNYVNNSNGEHWSFNCSGSLTDDDSHTCKLYVAVLFKSIDGTYYSIKNGEDSNWLQLDTSLGEFDALNSSVNSDMVMPFTIPIDRGRISSGYSQDGNFLGNYKLYFHAPKRMYGHFIITFYTPDSVFDHPLMRIEDLSVRIETYANENIFDCTQELKFVLNGNGDGSFDINTKFGKENKKGTLYSFVDERPLSAVGTQLYEKITNYGGLGIIANRTLQGYNNLLGKPVMTLNVDVTDDIGPLDHCTIDGKEYSVLARSTDWREGNNNITLYRYGED